MKRPLENLPPLDPAYRQALDNQLATRWFENPARAFKIGFRKASQLPLHCTQHHTEKSLLTFRHRDHILAALGIENDAPLLPSEGALHYPPQAPAIDDTAYFAQWAATWEPLSDELPVPVKYDRTLIVEIGAGFYLLSLAFTPACSVHDAQTLQLDRLMLRQGHDVFNLPLDITGDPGMDSHNAQRAHAIFQTARDTITTINDDYPMAETVLSEGLRPVIEELRQQTGLIRTHVLRPAAPTSPRDPGQPAWSMPQEP